VGLGPVFFPAQRGFGDRSVHRQPVPVDPVCFIIPLDARLPQREENPSFHPGLKPIMRHRLRAQFRLVQGTKLSAGPQDEEDRIGTGAIWHARASSPKAMGIDMHWEQRLEHGPQLIGDTESGRGAVIGRARSFSRLVVLFIHASYCSRLFGQAVSLPFNQQQETDIQKEASERRTTLGFELITQSI
jgi:hypothetical protein